MKRSLQVVGQRDDAPPAEPEEVRVGRSVVVVEDTGDGSASRRFAAAMIDAGAQGSDDSRSDASLRIVIDVNAEFDRNAGQATHTAGMPEFILGSVRPAFAQYLVARLEGTSRP